MHVRVLIGHGVEESGTFLQKRAGLGRKVRKANKGGEGWGVRGAGGRKGVGRGGRGA